METTKTNGEIIPMVPVVLRGWTTSSKDVRENVSFLQGVCQQEGALISVVVERRSERGTRLTVIAIRAPEPFEEEEDAMAWWARIVSRLQELPHWRVLAERLSRMSFSYTTPEILDLLRRRNGRGKPQAEGVQEWKGRASGIFPANAKAAGELVVAAQEPGETR